MSRRKEPDVSSNFLVQFLPDGNAAASLLLDGLMGSLQRAWTERTLKAEMDRHPRPEEPARNVRDVDGYMIVATDTVNTEIEVPHNHQGGFDQQLFAQCQHQFPGFDDKIMLMYARGMSPCEITGHLHELQLKQRYSDDMHR